MVPDLIACRLTLTSSSIQLSSDHVNYSKVIFFGDCKYLSEKEQCKPLLKELTNATHSGRGFLTNSQPPGPTRWKKSSTKAPRGGGGGVGLYAWNWLSHNTFYYECYIGFQVPRRCKTTWRLVLISLFWFPLFSQRLKANSPPLDGHCP